MAIIDFDDQTPDAMPGRAWGTLIARVAALQLAGHPAIFAFAVSGNSEAALRRASQTLVGTLTRDARGRLVLAAHLRDVESNRTLRGFTVAADRPGALAEGLASQFGKSDFSAGAVETAALEAAIGGQGDTSILGPITRAKLSPLPAALGERARAAMSLSDRAPADSELAAMSAALLMQEREFGQASKYYQRAARDDPDWAVLHNEAAFGFALAGDMPAALASLDAYRKLEPRSANPDDSQGEILFTARRFAEAERAFLAAAAKDPAFLGGAPLRKAAEARRASGNQAEADRLFARYVEVNAKRPLIALDKAQWDFTSGGREQPALAALEAAATATNATLAWMQVAAWRAALGRPDAAAAAQLALQNARSAAEQQAAAGVVFATQPRASSAEWQARATGRQPLIFALILGKYWREALPLIQAERDALPPAAAGFWQGLLAVAYAEAGDAQKAKAENRFAPIPRSTGDATWDFLVYPKVWRIGRS